MTVTDINVKVTFRNARILNAIKAAGYESQAECARAIGMAAARLNALVAMRSAPVGVDGQLSTAAQMLLQGLCLLPEDLWSEEQLYLKVLRNTGEFEITMDELTLALENENELNYLIKNSTITNRQLQILKERHCQELTYEEIGLKHRITRERVRQIEQNALKKLRKDSIKYIHSPIDKDLIA